MIIAIAICSIATFVIVFWVSGVIPAAAKAISTTIDVIKVLSRSDIDDEAKESATRKGAVILLGSVASIAIRAALAIVAAVAPIYVAAALGLASVSDTTAFLLRWETIVASSIAVTAVLYVARRLWPGK